MKTTLSLVALAVLAAGVRADDPSKDDLAAFKQYLEKNYKGKTWQTGPAKLDSKELQKAYPGLRFVYVYSSPPLPPGAALPELIERHRRAVEEFQKNCISLTAAIDKDGIRPLKTPGDFAKGLMAVKSDDDARVAAAAVISLHAGGGISTGPAVVSVEAVQVRKSDKGWTCTAQKPNQFQGTAIFDSDGKLTSVSKISIAPLPPSAPPRPR